MYGLSSGVGKIPTPIVLRTSDQRGFIVFPLHLYGMNQRKTYYQRFCVRSYSLQIAVSTERTVAQFKILHFSALAVVIRKMNEITFE